MADIETARRFAEHIGSVGCRFALDVAEFVADQEILDLVTALGVDLAQGYHIGHPMPLPQWPSTIGASTTTPT